MRPAKLSPRKQIGVLLNIRMLGRTLLNKWLSPKPWTQMPDSFLKLAKSAAAQAGFQEFVPDACLINRYEPGARLSLHQDKNERDYTQPIVSVSLGLPATFQFGGLRRNDVR